MNKRNLFTIGGAAAFGLALVALPASPARAQKPEDSTVTRLQQKLDELQRKLQAQLESQQVQEAELAVTDALEESAQAVEEENQDPPQIEVLPRVATDDLNILIGDDGSGWLGVETHEVTADKAKELKLSAERGVVLGRIVPDSPAAKAGLKENDVVTEINGQRVEGAAQFRRMIHEIPAGRSIQLTVWRDGRTQAISATLGKSEERHHAMKMVTPTPGTFAFRMPEIPEIPPMEWNGGMLAGGQPRLGIDAEDLSGQLGAFFGAPDGEGILVRDVNSGSPAEKAGVKAGDVITSLNGDRIRTVGDLREKLSAKRDDKDRTVKLGVLRNKSEISLTVELPAAAARPKRLVSRRTSI
ncbi:MAG TPA: PDZ domain-containing protein [Candidatus Dormibacteraeota bacterium]|nr:PDZ domain-containing protein [Candidatus Dormibacteraeota bacterium]